MVAISAHRGGAGPGEPVTLAAYERSARGDAEYVELDVRCLADGELVIHHDDNAAGRLLSGLGYEELCAISGHRVPCVRDALKLIGEGSAIAHLDLKEAGCGVRPVSLALELLGEDRVVVTTGLDRSIVVVKKLFPGVRTALSFGRGDVHRAIPYGTIGRYLLRRVRACGADWVAVNHRLTRTGLLRACAANGIGVMVWTVNDDRGMRRFLRDQRVDVLITDHPARALKLRDAAR